MNSMHPHGLANRKHLRKLTIWGGGGGFKRPPPHDLKNHCINLHYVIHVHLMLRMFSVKLFLKIREFDHFTAISKYKLVKIVVTIIFLLFCVKWTSNIRKNAEFECEANCCV